MKSIFTIIVLIVSLFTSFGQCNLDKHSTTWYDGWISCSPNKSPNKLRGDSHWILYDLGYNYALSQSHWWNGNEPTALNQGVKKFVIDVSNDGKNWTEVTTFELAQASGKNTYEGVEGPDLNKVNAKYILLTALENYGGECFSFGEMKINVDLISNVKEEVNQKCLSLNVYPNPFQNQTNINFQSNCNHSSVITIEDAFGRIILNKNVNNEDDNLVLNGKNLVAGLYIIKLQSGNESVIKKLIKIE